MSRKSNPRQTNEKTPITRIMANSPYSSDTIDALFSRPSTPSIPPCTQQPSAQQSQGDEAAFIQTAMDIGFRNPRISVYSPMAAAILEYLDRTTPQFCKSEMGAKLMDDALKRKFPELWNTISVKATTELVWIELNKKRRKSTLMR